MSIRVMTLVWEHSTQQGNDLLLLLAIADFADDNGAAFPSVERLARKSRMSERNTRYALKRLREAGELEVGTGAGSAKGTNRYQIQIQPTRPLFELGGAARPAGGAKLAGAAKTPEKGAAIAIAPEPSLTVIEKRSGQGKPSPVPALFKVYQAGIERLYGAEYPPSAKANGQLAQIAKTLGAERAAQALAFYLASRKPYYATRKHALDVFVRDAADLCIEAQQATGGAARAGPAPTTAQAYIEYVDAERVRMAEYPAGDALEIAKTFAREYASRVQRDSVSCVTIRQGATERRFKREELR